MGIDIYLLELIVLMFSFLLSFFLSLSHVQTQEEKELILMTRLLNELYELRGPA